MKKKNSAPPDPAIDEIRAIRHEISAESGHDPARLVASLIEFQKQFAGRLPDPAAKAKNGRPAA